MAYGLLVNFPGGSFSSAIVPKQSIWVSPSYRFKNQWNKLRVMGVFRYEGYDTNYYKTHFSASEVFENNLDYGMAVSGEFDRFSLQIEAVGRSTNSWVRGFPDMQGNGFFRKESRSDFQAIGTFVYRLTDQLALTYSLGDRFDPIINPENTLVSLLSLNFGFGSPTRDDLDL